MAGDTLLPLFKYHVIVTIIYEQRVSEIVPEETIHREMLARRRDSFCPRSRQKPSFLEVRVCLVFSVMM